MLMVGLVLSLSACGRDETALPALREAYDANLLMVQLHEAGITGATLEEPGKPGQVWVVRVPDAQGQAARQVMVQLGLPRSERAGIDALLEDQGMIPTPSDEQARLLQARANDVADALEVFDSVLRAHVRVSMQTQRATLHHPMAQRDAVSVSVAVVLEQVEGVTGPEDDAVRALVRDALGLTEEAAMSMTVLRQARTFEPLDAEAVAAMGPRDITMQLLVAAIALGGVAIVFMVLWVKERQGAR